MQGLYNDTITVFNCVKGGKGVSDVWIPTILRNVEVQSTRTARPSTKSTDSSDKVSLHIKYKYADMTVDGVKYLPPKAWAALGDKSGTFTINEGVDFFIKGEYSDTIKDEDYEKGYYNYLNSLYNEVWRITSVAVYKLIPHFEVGGA